MNPRTRTHIDPTTVTADSFAGVLFLQFLSNCALDFIKRGKGYTQYSGGIYKISLPLLGKEETYEILLTRSIIPRFEDEKVSFDVVDREISDVAHCKRYQLEGKIELTTTNFKFKPVSKTIIVEEWKSFDPLNSPPHMQSAFVKFFLGNYRFKHGRYLPAGIFREVTDDNDTQHVFCVTFLRNMFLREREHHPDEFRFEVLNAEVGKGAFGAVYRICTYEISLNGLLKFKRDDRILKISTSPLDEEHQKSRFILNRGSKRPFSFFMKGQQCYGRVEHFVEGQDLASLLKSKIPLSTDTRIALSERLLRRLIELHQLGIIHRDIKPANIIIKQLTDVEYIDLGVAKYAGVPDTKKAGTLTFMAPEIFDRKDATIFCDIFSIFIVLALIWGANEHPEKNKKQTKADFEKNVEAFSRHYTFTNLFSVQNNLSAAHKDQFGICIQRSVACNPVDRPLHVHSHSMLEEMTLERRVELFHKDERKKLSKTFKHAVKVRNGLDSYACFKLCQMDTDPSGLIRIKISSKQVHKNFHKELETGLKDSKDINLFIQILCVDAFHGLRTSKAILNKCDRIFNEYQAHVDKLHTLRKEIHELLNLDNSVMLKNMLTQIDMTFERRDYIPITLDGLVVFNHKCAKLIGEIETKLSIHHSDAFSLTSARLTLR